MRVLSAQTLSLEDRRIVAGWAADCAERVLPLFEAEAPSNTVARDAIARARAFGRGELDAATEIRRRLVAGRAARSASTPAGAAAARSAAQAAGVAHMGAHALGAAAYAVMALALSEPGRPGVVELELGWQLDRLPDAARTALRRLPSLGEDAAGPLGPGLLASGVLGSTIRRLQAGIGDQVDPEPS